MGLFSFLKKKESDVSNQKPFSLDGLNTDLPSIDGSATQEFNLPSLDEPIAQPGGQDSTEQYPDSYSETAPVPQGEHVGGYHDNSFHGLPDDISSDMNQLFLSDPEWKEPDWEHYEPYYEEEIEPPTLHDFGVESPQAMPPELIGSPETPISNNQYDIPEFEDIEPKEHHVPDDVPYDVFVKGTDYNRVFSEMIDVKKILSVQDEKMNQVLGTFKQEELTINSCKDNMEVLYKKMLMIDKKVFA